MPLSPWSDTAPSGVTDSDRKELPRGTCTRKVATPESTVSFPKLGRCLHHDQVLIRFLIPSHDAALHWPSFKLTNRFDF